VAHIWKKMNAYRVLVRNRKGTRPLRRHPGVENNIKIDVKEIGRASIIWNNLTIE
jgi:hypothetical protein